MKQITLILFLLISTFIFPKVNLETSTTTPSLNRPFTITLTITDDNKDNYEIMGLNDLNIFGKSSQQSIIANGHQYSSSKIIRYKATIGELKTYKLSLKSKLDNKIVQTITLNGQAPQINTNSDNVLLNTLTNKHNFYFGEKILLEQKLFTNEQIQQIGFETRGNFKGFLTTNKDIRLVKRDITYNGKPENEYLISQSYLVPNSSGVKTVTMPTIVAVVGDYFDQKQIYLGGEKITLNILPLPTPRPQNFQNIVGEPKIDYYWNSDTVNLGESLVLSVKIFGDANLDSLEKIFPLTSPDFNIYETLTNKQEGVLNATSQQREFGTYYSEKKFDIAIIPKKSGKIIIPEIKIPYFNTKSKKYENLIIPAKTIEVLGNNGAFSGQNNTPINNKVQNANTDIKPQPTASVVTISSISENNSNNKTLIIILLVALGIQTLVLIGFFVRNIKFSRSSKDLKALKNAKNTKEFYELYCEYMKKHFGFSPKAFLEDRMVKLGLSQKLIDINRYVENAYFNGTEIDKKRVISILKNEKR